MTSGIDLDGTVVAMTGASLGLGKSMSLALAKAGARVVLAAPEIDLLEAVAAEIEAKAGPGRALPLKMDITVRTDCERLLAESIRQFGKLQVLVNNARRPVRGPGLPPAGNFLPFWESNPYIWQESVQRQRQRHVPGLARRHAASDRQRLGPHRQHQHQPRRPHSEPQLALRRHQGGAGIRHHDLRRRSRRHRRHRQHAAAGRRLRHRPEPAARIRR